MIQKLNDRRVSTALTTHRETTSLDADGPESWGSWYNRRFYSLEIIQEPIRARMCGFGDKDRRPLAPATVAKLVIKNEDQTFVNDDDIDCSFFVVTADLWSSDGKSERNLVLHPTSSDRYSAAHAPKKRRPNYPMTPHPGEETSSQTSVSPSSRYPIRLPSEDQMSGLPHVASVYQGGSYHYTHSQHDAGTNAIALQQAPTYNAVTDSPDLAYHANAAAQAAHPYPSRPLSSDLSASITGPPPISSASTDGWQSNGVPAAQDTGTNGYRAWVSSSSYGAIDATQGSSSVPSTSVSPAFDTSLPGTLSTQYQSIELQEGHPSWSQPVSPPPHARAFSQAESSRSAQEISVSRGDAGPHTSSEHSMYASASIAQRRMREGQSPPSNSSNTTANVPLPGHVYTRTLSGRFRTEGTLVPSFPSAPAPAPAPPPLSISLALLSSDRMLTRSGICVSTGRFRLRLRLMNIGALPAPENGALQVLNDVSPILAQTYTQAFDVYSAKRFPGVPDTTALSIAFGNQGQKLPLRNRHGSSKHGRRRRRAGSDGSDDDDSDGG
ncbi:velvet factor-domain-containing protein [Multifurca ochricompacta]|uniref:Velvet factor-domain-containing protein n=1 Tax=Multifurca ochricompacta TaxID=376703 RepID=A0AAD4QPM8_9AGAM|nr:velvet factor-domain-containing protein [Multifurca ochricompacta]